MYLEEKVRLRGLFRSECSRVALTTDCWTSVQNLNYMVLTAHFIDREWIYQKRIISFSVVPDHKGETIAKRVEEVLREWGLKNVSTITVDNASSNDVAVAYLKNILNGVNGLVLEEQFFHMRCCAHILNLVVNDGLKEMNKSITSIRNAVRFVRSSPTRMAKFKECVAVSRISCKKHVCLDVPTRWNSTFLMLDAAEKFQAAFELLEFEDPSYGEVLGTIGRPTKQDWDKTRTFVKFLKHFYDATQVFSSSLHVSLHSAFHQLAAVYFELNHSAMNLNTLYASMGVEMKKKYDKYWGNINQLISFGVIFDPRYKLRYVEWSFEDMYRDQPSFAHELSISLKTNLFNMYCWYKSAHDQQNNCGQSSHTTGEGFPSGTTPILAENQTYSARTDAFKQHLRDKYSIDRKDELERYLSEPCVDGDEKFDLLVWWKQNSSRYPLLSIMVRDVLATPISTVSSESAFSTGGRVLDVYRSSLNPSMAEALICLQNWMKPSISQSNDINMHEEFEISEQIVSEFGGGSLMFGLDPSQSQPML